MQSLYGAIANYKQKEIMAISIDRVYQKVLALANKEQRGYITPQEFNLFADHAQMDIFEQYFYDLEQRQRGTGNELDYADIVTNLEEKISMFEIFNTNVQPQFDGTVHVSDIEDLYRLGAVNIHYVGLATASIAEQIQIKELNKYENSPLGIWTKSRPVYSKFSTTNLPVVIKIYPTPTKFDITKISYIRKPISPNWTYLISGNKNALYNPSAIEHKHFELHSSEETNLVVKILQLAGIAIKDFNLLQAASQEEAKGIQLEKQ